MSWTMSGRRLFPAKMRLLSHWNLRDQIKADYGEKDGLPRQKTIALVMEHIVQQTIPKAVVNNPALTGTRIPTRSSSDVRDHDLPGRHSSFR